MKIASVVGARPQFIKAAVVSRALRSCGMEEQLIHTGQHYDDNMSQVFFQELGIPEPDCNLEVGSASHGMQTGRMLERLELVLVAREPDWVLVYGDTNSTLAGALAAVKLRIPVAHVESGLRSFNRAMPEEINRVLTDHVSDLLFAPTDTAVQNLRREGIPQHKIHQVGDVMYDAALQYGQKAETQSGILQGLGLRRKEYLLVTIHRPENTDQFSRLNAICQALIRLAAELPVVFPIHPRTEAALSQHDLLGEVLRRLQVIPPVGYLDMIMLEKNARLIATDSGGVQKEAFFSRVPCLTLREQTEWLELLEGGWNRVVVPASADGVVAAIREALLHFPVSSSKPYGCGDSVVRIVQILQATRRCAPAVATSPMEF